MIFLYCLSVFDYIAPSVPGGGQHGQSHSEYPLYLVDTAGRASIVPICEYHYYPTPTLPPSVDRETQTDDAAHNFSATVPAVAQSPRVAIDIFARFDPRNMDMGEIASFMDSLCRHYGVVNMAELIELGKGGRIPETSPAMIVMSALCCVRFIENMFAGHRHTENGWTMGGSDCREELFVGWLRHVAFRLCMPFKGTGRISAMHGSNGTRDCRYLMCCGIKFRGEKWGDIYSSTTVSHGLSTKWLARRLAELISMLDVLGIRYSPVPSEQEKCFVDCVCGPLKVPNLWLLAVMQKAMCALDRVGVETAMRNLAKLSLAEDLAPRQMLWETRENEASILDDLLSGVGRSR